MIEGNHRSLRRSALTLVTGLMLIVAPVQGQSTSQENNTSQENSASQAGAAGWKQWRGPERDGICTTAMIPAEFTDATLHQQWRVPLGPGYSGPVVDAERVYVTETVDKKDEVVRALNRATGKEVWRVSWPGAMTVPFFAASNGSWIRSTPVLDEGRLYVGGMVDNLVCLNAETGDELWRVDFPQQLKTPAPDFGFASSPLVHGDAIYVQAGAAVHKLDKATGEILWKTLDDGGGMFGSAFSSPIVATLHDVEQLVVQTRTTLAGVELESGNVLWSQEIPSFRGMNILTPLVVENSIFTSSYRNKAWRLDIIRNGDVWGVEQRWEIPRAAYMSSPVYRDGYIYLHLGNQRFVCLNFEDGEVMWTSQPFGKYSSVILVEDRVVALDQRGELLLFKASPDQFELISQMRVSDDETWAHLALCAGDFFIRELNAITFWSADAQ